MRLYHYRPIESALLEIGQGTLHFATREELNDPIEGYVSVFWQGDKAAWEGLFRNYICSVNQALHLYLLQGDEDMIHHRTLVVDLHQFDDVPYGEILKDLGDTFLADDEIQRLACFYGHHRLKVQEKELRFILGSIHKKAISLCIKKCVGCKTIPSEEANSFFKIFGNSEKISFPFDPMEKELPNDKQRLAIAEAAGNVSEDLLECRYIEFGLEDENFLYGKRPNTNNACSEETAPAKARQRRDWMSIVVDFPKVYIAQLKDMIYPEGYVVCFSGKSDDSAMWGNYANGHQGVCLIYETDEADTMHFNQRNITLRIKPVSYGGDLLERNFFESFGRLNMAQINTWLTGTEGLSNCYNVFSDVKAWRDKYWETSTAKTYRKLKTWEHENEYRLALTDTLDQFSDPAKRNLQYEYKALRGVIFGINTSEYDKKRVVKILLDHADELIDFTFYQAEYDSETQRIKVRKKSFWELKKTEP